MKNCSEKIHIIDCIVSLHPAYGTDIGWSRYTGGMKDSGYWYYRKMLDVDIKELKEFFEKTKTM